MHVGSDEEMDFLGIPGLLEPAQMKELLQQRQASREQGAEADATTTADSVEQVDDP